MPNLELNGNVDILDFPNEEQRTCAAVWRLLHYAVSDANIDLNKNKPELINKIIPILQKETVSLTPKDVTDLLEAYNELSQLVYPATNESLWLKEKGVLDDKEKLTTHESSWLKVWLWLTKWPKNEPELEKAKPRPFKYINDSIKYVYWLTWGVLGLIILLFISYQSYIYFISDTLQAVVEQESSLKIIEDKISAAKEASKEEIRTRANLEAKHPFSDLYSQRDVIWRKLNSSYCVLRNVSFVWARWYPDSSINCKDGTAAPSPDREIQEKAARDNFFAGAKAVLRISNFLILPTLTGLLGALAYVIRDVLLSFSKSSFLISKRRQWVMRVALGSLLGMISGIVISPDIKDFKELSFTPLAWGFLMGYSVEFAFSVFDSLVKKGISAFGSTNAKVDDKLPPPGTPQVNAITPTSGSSAGGDEVKITGSGFTDDAIVRFGTNPAKSIVDGEKKISATSPPGQGTVSVTVSAKGVSSIADTASQFTYGGGSSPEVTDDDGDTHVCDLDFPIEEPTPDEELPTAERGVEP